MTPQNHHLPHTFTRKGETITYHVVTNLSSDGPITHDVVEYRDTRDSLKLRTLATFAESWQASKYIADLLPARFVETTWETASYDVWGNARDGYEVNDTYRGGEVTIRCRVTVNNAGTSREFLSAYPSDSQIRNALGLKRFKIDTDGDDLCITVDRARDSYPCGELTCTSHESLSPIRKSA